VYRAGLATIALLGSISVLAQVAAAQAPASADLWRLTATSLTGPAPLERGATAAFWNPAAAQDEIRVRAGMQVLETPDMLSVSELLAGVSYQLTNELSSQLVVGRIGVSDLPRTTTSPASEPGTIPVYEELLGVGAALHRGRFAGGILLAGHDARLDAERGAGVTMDAGIRLGLGSFTVAAATHFFPLNGTDRTLTDYAAGLEYRVASPQVWGSAGRVLLRYGVSARERIGLEHGAGAGLELARRFRLDVNVVREQGYADVAWRPTFGVLLKVGRYSIAAARATGLEGIGASYRVGLDVDVKQ
jgi:hypothetical protein